MSIKQLFKENRFFLVPYLFIILIVIFLLINFSKTELHIASNQINTPFLDVFFKYLTNLGDGVMIAVIFIVLLFIRYRDALAFLTGSLITALVINILKKMFFQQVYRPSKYFELYETYKLHFVEGVKLHTLQSFPSGHSGTAFNVFLTLAIISKNQWLKFTFLIIAFAVAYSRIYLSQHFLIDITAGSLIGTLIIFLSFYGFQKLNVEGLDKSIKIKK